MSLNSFKRKLTLLNVLMIYSVVFNISWGFCFYLAVNKESEKADLRTCPVFSLMRARLHASSGCSVSLWSVVIWGHLLYTTRSPGDAFPCTFFLLAEKQPGLMHLNGPAGAHLFRDGPPLWRLLAGPFSLPHNAIDWDGFSKHFHTRKHTLTRAYTLGFYRKDPLWSTVMGCYYLEASH